jgi:hypothetical protein
MKDFMRQRFMLMSDKEKEVFLSQVPPAEQIRLAEGNPHQTKDITTDGEKLQPTLVQFIDETTHDTNTD